MGNLQNRDQMTARKPNAILFQRYTDNALTATKLRRFSPRVLNATLEKRKENGCPAAAQRLERAQLTAAPRVRASGRPPIRAACGPGGLPRAQLTAGFFSLHSLSANCWPDDWHGNESFKTRPWLPSESSALESYCTFRVFFVFLHLAER